MKIYFQILNWLIWLKINQNKINYLNAKLIHKNKRKNFNFSNYLLPAVFLRDMYERRWSINDADEKQSIFYNEIKRPKYGKRPNEKRNLGF